MSIKTKIEWTDVTWNPLRGCSMVSEVLEKPLRWRKPRRVFVNSMSDLFHEDVPNEFIAEVWNAMRYAQIHTFQIITKRPERMFKWFKSIHEWEGYMVFGDLKPKAYGGNGIVVGESDNWPLPNVWLGVSVENQRAADERIPLLLQTPAAVRFLSMEHLLGPVDLSKFKPFDGECFCQERPDGCCPRRSVGCPETAIDWIIVEGESGPVARPMHPDWVRSIRDQCQASGAPFCFKQWGDYAPTICENAEWFVSPDGMFGRWEDEDQIKDGFGVACMNRVGKKSAGRLLDDRTWNEIPEVIDK